MTSTLYNSVIDGGDEKLAVLLWRTFLHVSLQGQSPNEGFKYKIVGTD